MKRKTLSIPVWPTVFIIVTILLCVGIVSAGTGSWDFWPEEVTVLEVLRAPNGDKVVRMECSGQMGSFAKLFGTGESTCAYEYNLATEKWTPEQRWTPQKTQLIKLYINYTAERAPCREYATTTKD